MDQLIHLIRRHQQTTMLDHQRRKCTLNRRWNFKFDSTERWLHCAMKLNAVDSKSTFEVGTNKYNNDITANLVARMKKRLLLNWRLVAIAWFKKNSSRMKSLSNCFYTQYHFGHSKYCDKNLFSVDFLYSLFEHNPENVIYFKVDFF